MSGREKSDRFGWVSDMSMMNVGVMEVSSLPLFHLAAVRIQEKGCLTTVDERARGSPRGWPCHLFARSLVNLALAWVSSFVCLRYPCSSLLLGHFVLEAGLVLGLVERVED
jgi:hypothetical protein